MSSSFSSVRSARVIVSGRAKASLAICEMAWPASWMRPTGPRFSSIQLRTTGSAVVHMSRRGSSERATPSTTTMVFCSSTSSVRAFMSKRPVISNSSVSSRAMEISSALREWIGSPMARIAWAKSSTRWLGGT